MQKSSLEFCEEFINEIKNNEKIQMNKYLQIIFLSYSIISAKYLYDSNQIRNAGIVKRINDA